MVEPISDEERESSNRRLKIGFAVLVGLSSGLMTLQGDPTARQIVGAAVGGLVLGVILVWFVFPDGSPSRRR